MKRVLVFIHLIIYSSFYNAQNFSSCKSGLNNYAWGLYNDTVLNKLIVFGSFNKADGKVVKGMATWDGQNFDSLGSGDKYPYGGKRESIIRYKNKLYVQFYDLYLYSFDYNTKIWTQIPGAFNAGIRDYTIFNDELIIVGDFTKVGSTTVNCIVKFNGSNYDTLPRPSFPDYLNAVEVYNNELYIGGLFNPSPVTAIAKFNGTNWVQVGNATFAGNERVYDLTVYNNKLYVAGLWSTKNGEPFPSFTNWDGQNWGNIGFPRFSGGQPASLGYMKVYNNKLYVFGGLDEILTVSNETIVTESMAVWNDTIWCGVKPQINFGIISVENYKGSWYFTGAETMYGDTIPYTTTSKQDTVNYLGKYIGSNGKLERSCFDRIPVEISHGVYPNPTNGIVNFSFEDVYGETCNLKIVNYLGQILCDYKGINSSSIIDITNYSSGVYLLIFYNETAKKTVKIIKQ